jgi:uncharacterized membrane protein YdjX (TVP38/TMEM64 family)
MTKSTKVLSWIAAAMVLVLLLLGGRRAAELLPRFAEWVSGLGPAGLIVFGLGYVAATVLLVPGSLLTMMAGVLFGVVRGTIVVLIAATVGACAAFLIARYVARERVAQRVRRDARFAGIDRAIGRAGRKIVILLRLSPVFPFNLLNYALGLTSVRFVDYLIACVAMLPGTLLYVYYGRVIGDVAALAAGARPERGPSYYLVLGVGLLATIVVTAIIARIAKRELARSAPDAV